MRATTFAACLLTAGLFVAGPAFAETVNYAATLDAASETPPNASKGTGTLKATYDTATKMLDWTVDYSGLTGEATAAHFHGPAPAGKSAGVMVPIKGSVASPIKGSAPLTDAQAKALTDGDMYFNVHTKANPGGEIRGQLEKAM
ncbi:MAG TPA: CHRD domain-containing protein [Lichenihabitans sp.]|jgi:hypothetical protein|nr:CHRD domain-containing protein [Lichenihabitans sp.]